MTVDLWAKVHALVGAGRVTDAARYLEQGLSSCSSPRFRTLLTGYFSNDPEDVATEISRFIAACEKRFPVKAVYLEMNGFDINPDRWYFDCFAYRSYVEDPEDLD